MHVSPVRAGLTESANGIRLTCVIQLDCGREVCPHPSAVGDKEPEKGVGREALHHVTGDSPKFKSVRLSGIDLCSGLDTSLQCVVIRESTL